MVQAALGHNNPPRGRAPRMYAIVFDFDTEMLRQLYPNVSWNNAYADVRNYLTSRGFSWKQGSVYYGDDSVDAVRCVRVVQRLSNKYPWFKPSVRDIRMLRIEDNDDLMEALEDNDD
jgi:virulence-associated protein VapD